MALTPLQRAAREHDRDRRRAARTRELLHAEILTAMRSGMSRREVAEQTGYTAERVRQIETGTR